MVFGETRDGAAQPLPPFLRAESGSWPLGSSSEHGPPPQASDPRLFLARGYRQELTTVLGWGAHIGVPHTSCGATGLGSAAEQTSV